MRLPRIWGNCSGIMHQRPHPPIVEWCRYQNHRSSYMALRSTARRFGFEVSWLIRLTRQETSLFGPCLTLRLHWQLVIRHSSGHAISLSCLTAGLSGKVMTLVACVFIWGSSRLSCIPNPTISVFFYNNREGPLQALLKPSLSISHIMASGDTCPLLAILVWSQPMG